MTDTNTPPDDVIDLVVDMVNTTDTDEPEVAAPEVRRVVAAYLALTTGGAPDGTMLRTAAGGMAIRVTEPGVGPCWKVTEPDGGGRWSQHTDLRPWLPAPWEATP